MSTQAWSWWPNQHYDVSFSLSFITSWLKLPSLFTAWLFWTFYNKSHNMKALVILKSFMITISPTYLFIWKKLTFVGLCGAFWDIFLRKNSSQITHANHMTITTSGQIWSWPDYCMTKENVNIKLLDLCLFTFYSVHANESTWAHMALAINRPDILLI